MHVTVYMQDTLSVGLCMVSQPQTLSMDLVQAVSVAWRQLTQPLSHSPEPTACLLLRKTTH